MTRFLSTWPRRFLSSTMPWARLIRMAVGSSSERVDDARENAMRRPLFEKKIMARTFAAGSCPPHNEALERNFYSCMKRTIVACFDVGDKHQGSVTCIGRFRGVALYQRRVGDA